MSDWQEAKPNRAVCMTAGDIHIGGFADCQLKKGAPLLNQIVASAIGNLPEGSTTALNLIGTAAVSHLHNAELYSTVRECELRSNR